MRFPLLVLLLLASCTSNRIAPIPDPLPQGESWERAVLAGAFLGVEVRANDSGTLDSLSFDPGVRVTHVVENSPASSAGLEIGDVILALDGQDLFDSEALDALLLEAEPETPLKLDVLRGDTTWQVAVTAAKRVGSAGAAPELLYLVDPQRSCAGWRTAPGGVRLVASAADAPFPRAGVPVGSTVLRIDDEAVLSAREFLDTLHRKGEGERIKVEFQTTAGTTSTTDVTLFESDTKITLSSVPILFHYEATLDSHDSKFVFGDVWLFSLFRYERTGSEREWTFLSLISFATGQGELEQ